jgi:UDP-glucose 4-epimerase
MQCIATECSAIEPMFIDTNITGTLNLLEAAVSAGVRSFIYTSTTSVFGDALVPPLGAPGAWITEDVTPVPKNIYGATKTAAEDLCQLFHRNQGLACGVLRTSRFFLEEDDNNEVRESFSDDNVKANEYLYRRVDIEDVVSAHLLAAERASISGFANISSAQPHHFTGTILNGCASMRLQCCGSGCRTMKPYTANYSGRCFPASSGSM